MNRIVLKKDVPQVKQIDLREGARRQHRAVSLFAVVQCWVQGLDGVVFERGSLERLLGLERFKRKRVKWLEEDLMEFFPYLQTYWVANTSSFNSLFVSRLPLKNHLPKGTMTTDARLKGIATAGGPKVALFKMWKMPSEEQLQNQFEGVVPFFADAANFDERFLSSYLSLLAQGQISPQNLPPLTVTGS